MESLRNAILLSNTGVHHLNCGNVDNALHSFQCAVVAVKVAIAVNTDPSVGTALIYHPVRSTTATTTTPRFPPKSSSQNVFNQNDISSSSIYQASKSNTATTTTIDINVPGQASVLPQQQQQQPSFRTLLDSLNVGISFIYNRPLFIPTDISIQSMEHLNSVVVTASTYIIFNFALTCQLVGKHTGKESYLIRAMRLYELTLKVLETAKSSSSTNPHVQEMHSVLECLALNNLAQMHYELCDYRSSQFYMDSMHSILVTIKRLDEYLDENEMEEIMLNLVYLQSPSVAKAA